MLLPRAAASLFGLNLFGAKRARTAAAPVTTVTILATDRKSEVRGQRSEVRGQIRNSTFAIPLPSAFCLLPSAF
jgi:hypothetical protein